ncbi:MAG: hypothetical protein VYA30_15610 [Myxococcota bacterium]|nr:hypothetical protein [Myxococcota bacterium]
MSLGAIGRAQAGLRVAGSKLDAVAHNTANMMTKGVRQTDVNGVESPAGVQPQVTQRTEEGIDPVSVSVNRTVSALTYTANLAVIKTADEMLGETIDLME